VPQRDLKGHIAGYSRNPVNSTCISDKADFSSVSDTVLGKNVSAALGDIDPAVRGRICRILTLHFWTAESVESDDHRH
jgi:hypothetical protein